MALFLNTSGDVTAPPKVESCVQKLLKSKSFMPKADAKKRKSSAYAICTASTKNKADLCQILSDLPPYVECNFSDEGEIQLTEVEDFDFAKFDEHDDTCDGDCKDCGACAPGLSATQIYFSDDRTEKSKEVFSSFTNVNLKENGGSKKVKREGPDGEEKEYTNVPIEMLREGTFRHPWMGDLVIDRKMMRSLVQNFANDILERELALDVSHEPDKGAYGWLRELRLKRRDFGTGKGKRAVLIGNFDLNTRGIELVLEEIFKYFSIEYHRNYSEREKTAKEIAEDVKKTPEQKDEERWNGTDKGKEYGPTIFGGALTNRPFIPSMKSVMMSEEVSADDEAQPTASSSKTQETTDGDGDVEENTDKEQGGNNQDGTEKKAAESNQDDSKRDKNEEIKNAVADKANTQEKKLPGAAFALTLRDRSGNVTKRSLPHHGPSVKSPTENSSVDKGRLRNALARCNQVEGFSSEEKARAARHLHKHAKALLPQYRKTKASEGGRNMFEDRIVELKEQLDALEDQKSELATSLKSQIAFMEKAQADHDAKLAETKTELSGDFTNKLSEQQALIEKLTERDTAREVKLAEITEKNRRTEIDMYCDTLGQSKYPAAIVKAVRNVLTGEVQQHSEGGTLVKFSDEIEEGKKEERALSLRGAVEYIVASIPDTHKTDLDTTIQHNQQDEPEVKTDGPGKVKLEDGTEVDVMEDDRIKNSIKKAGYNKEQDVQ